MDVIRRPGVPDHALEVSIQPIESESSRIIEMRSGVSRDVRVIVDELISSCVSITSPTGLQLRETHRVLGRDGLAGKLVCLRVRHFGDRHDTAVVERLRVAFGDGVSGRKLKLDG